MCESCPDEEQFEILQSDLERANKKICELERELSQLKGNVKRSSSKIDLMLTKGFDELNSASDVNSLLKKYLTQQILDLLKETKTKFKGTLLDCIQSGLEVLDSPIGAFACDSDAYKVFAPLFDDIIEELHGFQKDDKQPDLNWGESCKLPELDDAIISIRMQCSRSVECIPFAPIMSMEQYEKILEQLQSATKCLSGDLKGQFYALEAIDSDLKKQLIDDNLMFMEDNKQLKAANGTRFWPTGRGIFVNESKSFVVWCNEEDHLRFISTEQGGNLS